MVGVGSCFGRKPQKQDVVLNGSTKTRNNNADQTVDGIGNKTPHQLDSTITTQPHSQHSSVNAQQHSSDERDREKMIEDIVNHLKSVTVGKVVLYGEAGVGKTWIAEQVTKQVTDMKLFYVAIWVHKMWIHYSSVFRQISVQKNGVSADSDYYLDDEDADRSSQIQSLQQKLTARKCLVIFDDAFDDNCDDDREINVSNPMVELETILNDADKSSKVLITTSKNHEEIMMTTCSYTNGDAVKVEIKPLTMSESKSLLQRSWKDDQIRLIGEDDIEDIVKRCKFLPAAIVFTGTVLLYALGNAPDERCRKLAINEVKKDEIGEYWMLGCCNGFEKFRNNGTIVRCLWFTVNYLKGHRSMNYNKLILFWILDGCFNSNDNTSSLTKQVYDCAHKVLMGFLDAGLLGARDAGDVVLERAGLDFATHLFQTVESNKYMWEKSCYIDDLSTSGNVKHMNGSIGVFTKRNEGQTQKVKLVAFALMGNGLVSTTDQIKKDHPNMGESMRILFASRVKPIVSLQHLCPLISIVILKDCPSISHDDISGIKSLTNLRVLEVSGCSSLKKIPIELFANFDNLESLNLSGNPIKYFPRPSLGLNNLQSLFLKGCTQLESFPDVNGLEELRVLDLSGSRFSSSNSNVFDFERLPELRVLDLSDTNIDNSLDITELSRLNLLLLKNCPFLTKLESQAPLSELKVIELTGNSKLEFIGELHKQHYQNLIKV